MEINDSLLDRLAELSKLQFAEAEKNALLPGLQEMIEFVDCLSELDTRDVKPLLHMGTSPTMPRQDKAEEGLPVEAVFRNAAHHTDGFFTVPKMIKNPE